MGMPTVDMPILEASGPTQTSLDQQDEDFLRELTVFSIENSQIMTVPRVVGLRKLKLFKIDGSNIKDIPQRTLRDLPSLRYLHVSRSPITRLDIGVLENLKFLVLANFSDNQLNWVHPRAFRYMEVI
jgi:Leucine-rich repeat (LRR) protein